MYMPVCHSLSQVAYSSTILLLYAGYYVMHLHGKPIGAFVESNDGGVVVHSFSDIMPSFPVNYSLILHGACGNIFFYF